MIVGIPFSVEALMFSVQDTLEVLLVFLRIQKEEPMILRTNILMRNR